MSRKKAPVKHGTLYAYKHHRCRCEACREANRVEDMAYRRRRGVSPVGNVCEAQGRSFSSQAEAARAFGVSTSVIHYHLQRHGNLDRLGAPAGGGKGGGRKPVRVGVHEWPSRAALANHLGMSVNTVAGWIRRGRTELLIAAVMQAEIGRAAK